MGLLRHLASFALLTGMLSPAFRLRFEPTTHGFESRHRQNKNETPEWAFDFCGGDDGIRTHDTVARIPHFQCGALDQLCDISGFFTFYYSSSDSAPSSITSSATNSAAATGSSPTSVSSSSASISRSSGLALLTSNVSSAFSTAGVSL